jgi:hypothetical protein
MVTLAIIGQPSKNMTLRKMLPVAPIHGVVTLLVGDQIRCEMRHPPGTVATVTITNDDVLQLAREMEKG